MHIHVPTRTLLIPADDPFMIRSVISSSRTLDHDDYNVAVKHDTVNVRLLRNLGYDAPSPINSYYNWPGLYKPFDHQRVIAEFMTLHNRAFNLSEQGVGKTYASLWAADWLMKEGRVRKVLIIAPLSTIEQVWMKDIFKILMHRNAVLLHGSRERRLQRLAADVDFYIINHDGIGIKPIREALKARNDIDLIIMDEGSMFRNHDTDKWKGLKDMVRPDQRMWWLTGTPFPNSPADGWAQCAIMVPNSVPKYYGTFKRDVMVPDAFREGKWNVREGAFDTAYKAMQPAIRFKKADTLSLPPVTTQERAAELTTEQKKAFKQMKDAFIAELAQADKEGVQISAVNAADKVNKLRQILCGVVKTGEDTYATIPHEPRSKVMMEAIEGASAKVLIVVPFKGIIRDLEKEISKRWSVGVLNGDVSVKDRNHIINEFKISKDPHVLLCHPRVMSHGLNLVEADTLIFYAPIYSNDEYQQVIERFNRTGQTNKMTIIRIGAHAVEWGIYATLDERGETQNNILQLYRKILTTET